MDGRTDRPGLNTQQRLLNRVIILSLQFLTLSPHLFSSLFSTLLREMIRLIGNKGLNQEQYFFGEERMKNRINGQSNQLLGFPFRRLVVGHFSV